MSKMNILQITGNVRDNSAKKLEKLLATLDRDRALTVSEKMLEGTRTIGESHETIASALEEAERALSVVRSVEETLGQARSTLAQEFEARRADRSELVALTALFEQTSQELNAVRQREAESQRRLILSDDSLTETRAGKLKAELAASAKEAEVSRLNGALSSAKAEAADFKNSMDQALARAQRLDDDNARLRAKTEELETRRQEAEAQAASAVQAHSLLDVERGVLDRKIEAMTGELNRSGRTVADLEAQLSAEKVRARGLEAAAQSSNGEAERLGRAIEEQGERMRAELETLELRMDTAQARATRLEADNADVTRQLQDAVARDRLAEREIGETKLRLKQSDDQLVSLAADLTASRKELAAVEAARAAAVERSERLAETAEGRLADTQRLEEQIEVLQGRLDTMNEELTKERAIADSRLQSLVAAVERERNERHLESGALAAARKDRARLHMEVLKTNRGQNASDAAAALEDAAG
jgi:chromosome segregation ATPase